MLDRTVGIFDQALTLTHRIRVLFKQNISRIESVFFLPTFESLGVAGRTLRLQRTASYRKSAFEYRPVVLPDEVFVFGTSAVMPAS